MAPSKVKLSETAMDGCCKLCAEPEKENKRFLICDHSLCMYKYYHIRCMKPYHIASKPQKGQQRWYCPSCLCRDCFINADDEAIIMCDYCDEAYHIYCLKPPLRKVPKGEWLCKFCDEAKALEHEVLSYEKKMLELHGKGSDDLVKSEKYAGFEVLVSCVEKVIADEAAEAEAKKVNKRNERMHKRNEKKKRDEKAATVAEKMDEEVATVAE